MSEEKLPEEHKGEDRGYTPASPLKRTMAWIALAYVLILLALTTYYFYTGTTLGNLAPLLTVPGLIGLGALALVSWRSTQMARHPAGYFVLAGCPGHSAHRHCGPAVKLQRVRHHCVSFLIPDSGGSNHA